MLTYNVIYDSRSNSWCVTKNYEKVRCYGNKRDAVNVGQSFARRIRNVELRIHDENGNVECVVL